MRNLFLLLRCDIEEELDLNSNKKTVLLKGMMAVLLAAALMGVFYGIGQKMVEYHVTRVIPVMGYMVGSILCLVMTILKINETLVGKGDTEFRMALPIGSFTQVLSIFIQMYVRSTVLVLLTNFPMMLAYKNAMAEGEVMSWGRWAFGVIMTSMPYIGIASLIALIIGASLATSAKGNLIHSLISLGFLGAIVLLVVQRFHQFTSFLSGVNASDTLYKSIVMNNRFARLYQRGVVEMDITSLFLFIVISSIWNFAFLFFLSVSYQEFVIAFRSPKNYGVYEFTTLSEKSMKKALFGRELQQWLHSKSYMVNTVLGMLMAVLISVMLAFKGSTIDLPAKIGYAVPFILCIFIGMSCSTYCSYSLEGKRRWIMETMPMNESIIADSKKKLNLWITVPASLVCIVLLVVAFRPSILMMLLYIILPLVYCYFTAWWGLVVGRKYADYSNESELHVMRQGLPFVLAWLPGVLVPVIIALVIMLF